MEKSQSASCAPTTAGLLLLYRHPDDVIIIIVFARGNRRGRGVRAQVMIPARGPWAKTTVILKKKFFFIIIIVFACGEL